MQEKLLLSKTSGEVEYDAHFVKKLFLHTLERSFESVNVLQEVRSVFRHPDTKVEQILSVTQRESVEERENQSYYPVKHQRSTFFRVIIVLAVLLVPNTMTMNSFQIGSEFTSVINKVNKQLSSF